MASHFSILAWRIPGTEEPSGLWSMGLQSQTRLSMHAEALMGFPGGSDGKEPAYQCRRCGFNPWVGKIPWRRKWQPTPVFLPGKVHGQRSLVGCSPWGGKELDIIYQQ